MEKEFVGFEESLALKDLGFNEPCMKLTQLNVGIHGENKQSSILQKPIKNSDGKNIVTQPLWQQAVKWFRTNYNLHFPIMENISEYTAQGSYKYIFSGATYGANTYEEAEFLRLIVLIQLAKRLQKAQISLN